MASYTVHLPAGENPEQARFLDDRVSIVALVFPWLYLLWHRLWFAFGLYCIVAIAIGLVAGYIGPVSGLLLSFLPGLYLFVSAKDMVRAKWDEKGWPIIATVEAGSLGEAEFRFFHDRPESKATEVAGPPVAQPFIGGRAASRPAPAGIGLFD